MEDFSPVFSFCRLLRVSVLVGFGSMLSIGGPLLSSRSHAPEGHSIADHQAWGMWGAAAAACPGGHVFAQVGPLRPGAAQNDMYSRRYIYIIYILLTC